MSATAETLVEAPERDSQHVKESSPSPREFDPSAYVRQLRSRGGGQTDYLDVKHRLLWLRTVHPDAQIVTELIRLDDQGAVFKALVTIPGRGSATGHGSETARDFNDYIEKAETKALGRALNALGFGAQFAENDADEPRSISRSSPNTRTPERQPAEPPPQKKSPDWTLFWEWARASGFPNPAEVERVIGKPIAGLSPAELQKLLAPRIQEMAATA